MRICDWSSDVCSSDLAARAVAPSVRPASIVVAFVREQFELRDMRAPPLIGRRCCVEPDLFKDAGVGHHADCHAASREATTCTVPATSAPVSSLSLISTAPALILAETL